jgi:ATPase subunit of ABC transporter with duplicated ATPase domains
MPSTVIDARRITRRHAARTVLDAVDLNVGGHSRIAIVGPKGSGKSTLLRVLAGVPQLAGTGTVRETILEQVGVRAAARELDVLAGRLEAGDLDAIEPMRRRWSGGSRSAAPTPSRASPLPPLSSVSRPSCSTGR